MEEKKVPDPKGKKKTSKASKADDKAKKPTIGPNETVKKFEEFASEFAKRWAYRDESANFS